MLIVRSIDYSRASLKRPLKMRSFNGQLRDGVAYGSSFWREFIACNFQGTIWVVSCFDRKFFVCSYTALKEITTYAKWSLIICVQSTFALRTPRYNGHPDNTDSSQIPGKNKLQTFDWNKLLPLLWTLVSEDTNSRSLTVSAIAGVNWSPRLLEFCSPLFWVLVMSRLIKWRTLTIIYGY